MAEPRVQRRASHLECGELVGRLNVKLSDGTMQFIAIPCTKQKLHTDACEFVGVELVVSRRRRDDGHNSIVIPSHG